MKDATLLRTVREHFALNQAALAPWLGLSRSLLALVETERALLPRHARPWLQPWLAALALPDMATVPVPELLLTAAADAQAPASVQARLLECSYQAQRLRQQQQALAASHRCAARHLQAGPLLQAALPPPVADEPLTITLRRRWLTRLLEAATDALLPEATTGPVAAALLAARCRAYLHEAACLRAWAAGESAPAGS